MSAMEFTCRHGSFFSWAPIAGAWRTAREGRCVCDPPSPLGPQDDTSRAFDFVRASGEQLCAWCGELYRRHPHDPAFLSDGRLWLRILCDTTLVKL